MTTNVTNLTPIGGVSFEVDSGILYEILSGKGVLLELDPGASLPPILLIWSNLYRLGVHGEIDDKYSNGGRPIPENIYTTK